MMKKFIVFAVFLFTAVFLLSGCTKIKELYGIKSPGEGEYVPLEEIKIEELKVEPPSSPEGKMPEIKGVVEEIIKEIKEESAEGSAEQKPKKDAKVIIVEETDTISFKPKAVDPDGDILTFTYTSPLDQNGKWKTMYGNAGEYTVTVTASDGELSTARDVLIIVNKKEEAPVIEEALPKDETLSAKEDSKLEFSVKASDLNKDPLKYSWKLDGNEVCTAERYLFNISYDDAGQHTVKVLVSDGTKEASKIWALSIANVNRNPILSKIADIRVKENETIIIEPKATDPDKDKLTFSIDSDRFKKSGNRFEWKTNYDDAGRYSVLVMVSDGKDEASQEVKLTVENVNRAPNILDVILE